MNEATTTTTEANPWLSRFAKVVVLATFWLLFTGGHTTTTGAGMAFADWPMSNGSINPPGWWDDMMMRLEHGHRWTAGPVGVLVGILCAWIWRSRWSVPISLAMMAATAVVIRFAGASIPVAALVAIVVAAAVFGILLVRDAKRDSSPRPGALRWLAYAAFLGVCAQASLGGLRVILDPTGVMPAGEGVATAFRVVHGSFAQIELCLLVMIAAMLSPVWGRLAAVQVVNAPRLRRLAWLTVGFIFAQLIVGATMRHLGAGLAIPTFPAAAPDGSWVPEVHNLYVDLNFTHTRVIALLVTIHVVLLAIRALRSGGKVPWISRLGWLVVVLVVIQVKLGMLVVWKGRDPMLTTFHVLNGAALLAATVLLAARAGRCGTNAKREEPETRDFVEVPA